MERTLQNLNSRQAFLLMAPNTLGASILPVIVAASICLKENGSISWLAFYSVLTMGVLMQAAANVFNDYYDFKKGTDTIDNSKNPEEVVLVYNAIALWQVLALGGGMLLTALTISVFLSLRVGGTILFITIAGAFTVLSYSGGRLPISYLPLGELVSGGVMGLLLPLAAYKVLGGMNAAFLLLSSVPVGLGIGLMMMTNNVADIEKDKQAGRRTLAVLLGHQRSKVFYQGLVGIWVISYLISIFYLFPGAIPSLPLFIVLYIYLLKKLLKVFLKGNNRKQFMKTIMQLNIFLDVAYIILILLS